MRKCRKTHKIRYRDDIAAKLALARVSKGKRSRSKDEQRAYFCSFCRGYHLTSQPHKYE